MVCPACNPCAQLPCCVQALRAALVNASGLGTVFDTRRVNEYDPTQVGGGGGGGADGGPDAQGAQLILVPSAVGTMLGSARGSNLNAHTSQ